MKVLILLCSYHHKSTQKVAHAVSEILDATVLSPRDVNPEELAHYDLISFGSGIYDYTHHKLLLELAEKKKLKIMVDHTFLYTGAVRKIKQLIEDNVLGDLYYFDSIRVNLGLFQHDVNVVWDLAAHDISIMDYLIDERPQAVSASGAGHFGRGLEDIAYLTFYYGRNIIAHINVNWLSPVKVRMTLIGGQKKMLVWNDLEPDEKIKIYDKGVQVRTKEGKYNLLVDYRSGDMWSPKLEQTEALKAMVEAFVDYVENGGTVVNDGIAGLNVVKMLTAANQSLNNKNQTVYL